MEQSRPQYSNESIARYEVIFGKDFVSTGGLETTRDLAGLGLRPGMQVLDAGCGLGGSAFYMAKHFGVEVLGVDLLPQMIVEARRRAAASGAAGVRFEEADLLEYPVEAAHFDLVYSRDAFLHISDKAALFRRLHDCLRPGGMLFFTGLCLRAAPRGVDFEAYRGDNAYDLHEVAEMAKWLAGSGFGSVEALDRTTEFVAVLRAELQRAGDAGGALSAADRDYLLERWGRKIRYCEAGDMRWCSITARRPK